jgi:hypothetical protein
MFWSLLNRRKEGGFFCKIFEDMSTRYEFSRGVPTPPPSEDGGRASARSSLGNPIGCPVSISPLTGFADVNNSATSPFPPSSPPRDTKSRARDRSSFQTQREANRSKQFTTRLQRSDSGGSDPLLSGRRRKRGFSQQNRQANSLPAQQAIEPPHEQILTKMAFAEQQKWITVQQKTFTKWYVR